MIPVKKMKNFVSKVKTAIYCNSPATRENYMKMEHSIRILMLFHLVLCLVGQILVYAAEGGEASNATTMVTNLLNIMIAIFKYVGFALIVWGITQFLLAVKKSDAESKSEAVTTVIVGIALVSLAVIVNSMGMGIEVSDDAGVFG